MLRDFEVKAAWAKKIKGIEKKLKKYGNKTMVGHTWEEKKNWQTTSTGKWQQKESVQREKEDTSCVIRVPHKNKCHESSHIYYNDVIIAHFTQRGLWDKCVKSGYLTWRRSQSTNGFCSGFHGIMGHRPIWDTHTETLT